MHPRCFQKCHCRCWDPLSTFGSLHNCSAHMQLPTLQPVKTQCKNGKAHILPFSRTQLQKFSRFSESNVSGKRKRAAETAQCLKAQTTLLGDLNLIPSTYMTIQPPSVTPVLGEPTPSSGPLGHQEHTWHTDFHAGKTPIRIK